MRKHFLTYKKKYGQVFLNSKRLARRIVNELNLSPEDWVIEIGPGKGILTEILIEKANKIIAVEIDPHLTTYLKNKFRDYSNIEIINKDIRKFDLSDYPDAKIIGNIPYYLSGDLLFYLIENSPYWKEVIIMVQKEFGDRLISKTGVKSYGAITLIAKKELNIELLFYIRKGNFKPVPKVDSALLKLQLERKLEEIPFKNFTKLIKASFSTRRKKLINNLMRELKINREELKKIFLQLNLQENIRSEELSMSDFARLYHAISNIYNF